MINQNNMTAVEKLVSKLFNPEVPLDEDIYNAVEQAKEMEREQIVEAYYKGGDDLTKMHFIEPKDYYNQTFKSE